jgi:hypothetical protein
MTRFRPTSRLDAYPGVSALTRIPASRRVAALGRAATPSFTAPSELLRLVLRVRPQREPSRSLAAAAMGQGDRQGAS